MGWISMPGDVLALAGVSVGSGRTGCCSVSVSTFVPSMDRSHKAASTSAGGVGRVEEGVRGSLVAGKGDASSIDDVDVAEIGQGWVEELSLVDGIEGGLAGASSTTSVVVCTG